MRTFMFIATAALVVTLSLAAARAVENTAAKADIKQFMKDTHKGNTALIKRATEGQASPAEVQSLLVGYRAMAATEPPRGELSSWKEKTGALVAAAELLAKSDATGAPALKKAANCKACHGAHKPE